MKTNKVYPKVFISDVKKKNAKNKKHLLLMGSFYDDSKNEIWIGRNHIIFKDELKMMRHELGHWIQPKRSFLKNYIGDIEKVI